jgi:hypothetical protein
LANGCKFAEEIQIRDARETVGADCHAQG